MQVMKYGLIFCSVNFWILVAFVPEKSKCDVVKSEVFNVLGISVSERDMQNWWAADYLKSVAQDSP